jgi:hypothetical protein
MDRSAGHERTIISGRVTDAGGTHGPVRRAEVRLSVQTAAEAEETKSPKAEKAAQKPHHYEHREHDKTLTDDDGRFRFTGQLDPSATYRVEVTAFGQTSSQTVTVTKGSEANVPLTLPLNLEITTHTCPDDGTVAQPSSKGRVGRRSLTRLEYNRAIKDHIAKFEVHGGRGASVIHLPDFEAEFSFGRAGMVRMEGVLTDRDRNSLGERAQATTTKEFGVSEPDVNTVGGRLGVALERTAVDPTLDQALWVAIRNRTKAISFGPYRDFIDRVLRSEDRTLSGVAAYDRRLQDLGANLHGVGAYQLLKTATEVFLLLECGVRLSQGRYEHHLLFNSDEESARLDDDFVTLDFIDGKLKEYLGTPPQLPYITRVVEQSFPEFSGHGLCCDRVVSCKINEPCLIELIWSYWHEEGMLAQSMNAINRRFQNVRASGERDPLAHLEIDPLRRVGNLLWGQIQDEINLLSVKRRAYEYSHHYGLSLYGRAAGAMRPADNRSKFLEAFHNLLHLTSIFYKEDNDTTVIADGFPLLNSLKEVHLLLAQGAHNQFGDLPWTARAEMLVQEYILARPEIRDFLQSRHMVPYKEAWMPQADTMKTLQGWSDVTITHFRDLGVYGEQILLSIRYGDWIDVSDEDSAKNWARYWRPEVQGYLHAYRAVTGVDLTNPDTVDATVPAVHLQKRLAVQQRAR